MCWLLLPLARHRDRFELKIAKLTVVVVLVLYGERDCTFSNDLQLKRWAGIIGLGAVTAYFEVHNYILGYVFGVILQYVVAYFV